MVNDDIIANVKAERQRLLDIVARHLAQQGGPARSDGKCLYRGPNGTKCAVGVLLENKDYDPEMENHPVSEINLPEHLRDYRSFLEELQLAHDDAGFNGASWTREKDEVFGEDTIRERLTHIAITHGLNTQVIDEVFADFHAYPRESSAA